MLAHVPSFGRNPRGSPDFLAYPVPKACMHVLGTRVPRRLGVARSASSPKAAQALGCSLTPGLRISFGRVTCMARAASVPGLWALGFLLLACVCGWVRVAVGRGFCLPLPVVAGVLGGCVWARFVVLSLFCRLFVVFVVGLWCGPAFGTCVVSCAFPLPPAVSGSGVRCGRAGLGCAPPFLAGVSGCVFCAFFFFFFFFSGCWVSLSRALWSLPRLLSFGGCSLFFFFVFSVSLFSAGPLSLPWCCRSWLGGPPVPVWGSCLRCPLGGGFGPLLCCWWAVWWLWAVFARPPPPPFLFFFFFFFSGGGACRAVPPVPFPRLAVALWLVCGVVGPSPLLAEVPVCYSPPLLAGFRCRWLWAVPATPGWGLPAAVVSGVWRWCVGGVVAGVWCGWSLATPGGGSCVLLPATPGWVSLPVVLGGPRHSWLGSVGGVAVWCVVCGGGVLVGLWLVCGVVGPSPLLAEVPVCYSPPLLAGFRFRWWWAVPATPGWGPLAALLCGVWCVALVCWWGCGWRVVWLVPRHSWRRFLCATPRHSWLGFASGGGGRSPPLLAGVRWRRCCVVCGVWRWCVGGVVAGVWCGWSLATPGGGSCVLLPATPGWVLLPVVVGGPRHSWLGSVGGVAVWCVVCGAGVLVGLWLACGVVGPSPLLAEVPVCYSPPLLAGFRCRWWWAVPATPGWGPLAAVVCVVWCVVCGGGVLVGLWLVCGVVGPSPLLAEVPVCYSPPLLAGFRFRWWWAVPATPGWGPLAALLCGVWCVALVCWWGCGWRVVWLVPRHSWRRFLCATPRHSWLGFASGGGGRSPPLLAGVRWRRCCVVCGVRRWCVGGVVAGVWCGWFLATPGGGSCVLLPATPGWVSLPVVVGGPRHSWLGSVGGVAVWCVVCGAGVWVGLWLACGVVGPSPLLAEVPVCYSPPLLAGFRCRWWWAVPATPGWGPLAAVVCGVWCVVCGGGVLVGLWLVCGVVGPSPLLAEVPVCYSPPLLAGFRFRWWWAVPATPGWGPLAALLCGVWCVALVCWWGCGWRVVWLVPRHSWRRFLCATPRHSWLGFAAGGGGRSPPLLAGVRWRRCCVVCGVWRWCVGGVVAGVWCGWSLATPGGGSCVLLPATPGWVSLPLVVGGPRHSWLGCFGGGGVRVLLGRVGRAGLPGALWCASPFPLAALSFCFAWPPPGWGCPPLLRCCCRFSLAGVCGVWVGCCLAPVRVPWFFACCARSPGLWHPAAVAAWHLSVCLGCGRRRASLACLVAPRGAPRLVRSGRSRCSGRLSRRRGAFPHPGSLRPRLYWAAARGTRRPAENRAHCACRWPPPRQGRWALRVVPVRGPAMGLSLAGPSGVGLGLRALRWLACVDPVTDASGFPYRPSFDGGLGRCTGAVSCGRRHLPLRVGGRHARVPCVSACACFPGRVGRAGLPGAFWCASPFPLAALSFCFAWPPPGWGCPSLFRCCCLSPLVVFYRPPAAWLAPRLCPPLGRWLLFGGCSPAPPPFVSRVFVAPACGLGVFFFFFFFFFFPFSLRPRCLRLSLVSGPGCPGPRRLRCLFCRPSASRLSVRLSLFRAFPLAVGCSRVVAAPPPPRCVPRFSFLPLGAVCRVVLWAPGAVRCCAALLRVVSPGVVLACAVLRSFGAAACCAVPSGAARRSGALCSAALCFAVFPRAVCSVCFVVARWCVLCVPCALRSVRCCASLCWCARVVLFVWCVLLLALGVVVRCCVLCCFLWCAVVRCWVWWPVVVCWWRVSVSVSLSGRVVCFPVLGVVCCGALLSCVVFCGAVLSRGAVLLCSALVLRCCRGLLCPPVGCRAVLCCAVGWLCCFWPGGGVCVLWCSFPRAVCSLSPPLCALRCLVVLAVVPCFPVSCAVPLCCRVVLCCRALLSFCGAVCVCFALLRPVVRRLCRLRCCWCLVLWRVPVRCGVSLGVLRCGGAALVCRGVLLCCALSCGVLRCVPCPAVPCCPAVLCWLAVLCGCLRCWCLFCPLFFC